MKIFLSYEHDSNAPLIEKIKEYLSKDAEGNLKHEVWMDKSEIKAGKDWREKITEGVLESDVVLEQSDISHTLGIFHLATLLIEYA